ncbi:MAG: peptide/nickel transport system substrate-binding protein [Gaiellales bacterium]|nr:peptide/nickel transport system substrate-binding protein [Gaiellales bacterium]
MRTRLRNVARDSGAAANARLLRALPDSGRGRRLTTATHASLLLALLLLAPGCGRGAAIPAPPASTPLDGGTLRYALSADPVSVTPLGSGDAAGLIVERNVFAGLVDLDPGTLQTVPAIARRWSVSADARTITFSLRAGVRFQAGAGAVTAETFVRDWSLLCSPSVASPNASLMAPIAGYADCRRGSGTLSGVRASGALTLIVTLEQPFRDFVSVLTDPATWAFPPQLAASAAQRTAFEQAPVGAGPFQIASWTHGQAVPGKAAVAGDVILERNPGYYGRAAHLQRIDLPVVDAANPAASFARYRGGDLDVLEVAASQVDVVRADPTFSRQLVDYPRLQLICLIALDPRSASLSQRTALAAALDPGSVVSDVFGKAGQVADGLVPAGTPGYLPGVAPPASTVGPGGLVGRVVLERPKQPLLQAMADSLLRHLRNAGVSATSSDHGAYQLRVLDAGYPSPDALLAPIVVQTGASPGLLDDARAATDAATRDALYVAAERTLLARRVVMPIAFGQTELLVAPRVEGLMYHALGAPRLADAWIARR